MKNIVLLATMVAIVFFACKKDEPQNIDDTPVPEPKVSMMPLKEGNYWVYQRYSVDTNGISTTNGQTDSLYISGKEIIHGDTFYVIKGSSAFLFPPDGQNVYLRDSVGYLVDQNGSIYYSETNYTDTFSIITDSIAQITRYEYMTYKDSMVTVPAGSYSQTGTLLTTVSFWNPNYPWESTRDAYYSFAKNVGLIKRRAFYSAQPTYFEFQLLRYHVSS